MNAANESAPGFVDPCGTRRLWTKKLFIDWGTFVLVVIMVAETILLWNPLKIFPVSIHIFLHDKPFLVMAPFILFICLTKVILLPNKIVLAIVHALDDGTALLQRTDLDILLDPLILRRSRQARSLIASMLEFITEEEIGALSRTTRRRLAALAKEDHQHLVVPERVAAALMPQTVEGHSARKR